MDFTNVKAMTIPEGEVKKITNASGVVLWEKQSSGLPTEYQQVEFISSTGTQYIDLNFIPNQDTTIEVKLQPLATTSYRAFAGSRTTGTASFCLWSNISTYRADYLKTNYSSDVAIDINTPVVLKLDKNKFYINGVLKKEYTKSNFSTGYSAYLFNINSNGSKSNGIGMRMFYCDVYDNDTLIRKLIPCYRKSDNVVGMYDLVDGIFYTNIGTNTFLKGSDV